MMISAHGILLLRDIWTDTVSSVKLNFTLNYDYETWLALKGSEFNIEYSGYSAINDKTHMWNIGKVWKCFPSVIT